MLLLGLFPLYMEIFVVVFISMDAFEWKIQGDNGWFIMLSMDGFHDTTNKHVERKEV